MIEKEKTLDIYNSLLEINFEKIHIPKLNCFNSNNLSTFSYGFTYGNQDNKEISNLFSNLIKSKEEYIKDIDILDINAVSASKSIPWGYIFDTLYLFGENLYNNVGKKWSFNECIKHSFPNNPILKIHHYKWNNRITWSNSDGSHHFGVAVFHAKNSGITHLMQSNIKEFYIDENIANELLTSFDIFICHSNNKYDILSCLENHDISILNSQEYLFIMINKGNHHNIVKLFKKFDDKIMLDYNEYLKTILVNNAECS